MRSNFLFAAILLLALSSCSKDNSTQPTQKLEGTWTLVGYSDQGVAGTTTGTVIFKQDGTFTMTGTVTYPGEPTDFIDNTGTYDFTGKTVVLTVLGEAATWNITFSGNRAILTLVGSSPPTTMTLERQS